MRGISKAGKPVFVSISHEMCNEMEKQLRGLFETDLREHGFTQTLNGGLIDRRGLRYWVFDIDGTRQAAR